MHEELVNRLRNAYEADTLDNQTILLESADAIEEMNKCFDGIEADNDSLSNKVIELSELLEKGRPWTSVTEKLPEADTDVLAYYEADGQFGKRNYTCRASYIPRFTVKLEDKWSDPDYEWSEYNEEEDEYYVPEGWYEETSQGDGDYMSWHISTATVTHWMELPKPPKKDGENDEHERKIIPAG